MGPTLPGRGSASNPRTSELSRKAESTGRSRNSGAAFIDIDDDDLDELANESVPCSSPYFTQPTQLVSRTTQPTQIVNRTGLREPSSPIVPSTPSTAIEVPASSPFQSKSQARPLVELDKKPNVTSKFGSLMAPAGTSFRPPAMQQASHRAKATTGQRGYLDISDDDLLEDYKKHDSSDDDTPTRGDIRPSSFVKRESSSLSKLGGMRPLYTDISLTDIRDIRLRHLTGQVYKIVQKAKPGVTILACKEALQKEVGWQVSKAVDLLTGRPTKLLSVSSKSASGTKGTKTTSDDIDSAPSSTGSAQKNLHPFFTKSTSNTNSSTSLSQSSTQLSRVSSRSSNNSALPEKSQQRRQFLQELTTTRKPSKPFSESQTPSSSSFIDTFDSIDPLVDNHKMPRSIVHQSSPEAQPPTRRRLVQGRRNRSPQPITISSDSESHSSPISRSTRSHKRSAQEDVAESQPKKKAKVEHQKTSSNKRKYPSDTDPTTPPSDTSSVTKKAKIHADVTVTKEPARPKRKAEDELQQEEAARTYQPSSPESEDDQESDNVKEYLNTCTVEALGRMIGSAGDAKLMIAARPFRSLSEAKKVCKLDKSKSKTKPRRVAIGEAITEKLAAWLEACDTATHVIDECAARGQEIQSIVSTWAIDRNGVPREGEGIVPLPIAEKPQSMASSLQMHDYQLVGLNWMELLHSKGYSGILADDMGLGKTCQVVSFIAHLVETEREPDTRAPWPNLIVVPPSTYEAWIAEFHKFAPGISVLAYSGKDRRNIKVADAKNHHVVLTTYPQIEKQPDDLRFLQKINPYAAIFDEGHKLKNQNTLIYQQMMQVPTEWRLILSGTPVQNNLKELLTVLRFIEPSLFSAESFDNLNTIFEAKCTSKDVLNFAALASERVSRARAVMAPFILQRRKEHVIDLPKKTERLELVDMHPTQKKIYDSIKGGYKLNNGVKAKDSHPWMQLRKASIHHLLFRTHFTDRKVQKMVDILWENLSAEDLGVQDKSPRYKTRFLEEYMKKSDFDLHLECKEFKAYIGKYDIPHGEWNEAPKVKKLLELIKEAQKNGDRILIFTRFEMVSTVLTEALHYADIPYCYLSGNTDTSLRFPECQRFTENPNIPVFILTTGAGGTGLNLTAANKIVIFDQSDNPQDDVQASNRAHRIGQDRDVEIIRLITRNSVECLIYNSCVKKLALAARVEQEFGVEDEDEESVEEQCKKRMLLGDEIELLEPVPTQPEPSAGAI